MSEKFKLTSFENASLLRKLTIYYFLASIVPLSVLYYFYMMLRKEGEIRIDEPQFALVLAFIVLGVAVGYFALRSIIMSIVRVTTVNAQTLKDILGPDKVKALSTTDRNEIAVLARSFNEVTSHLEENVRNLELAKRTLHSVLSRIGEGISSMDNIDNFLTLIVETVVEALDGRNGALFLKEDGGEGNYILKFAFGDLAIEKVGFVVKANDELITALGHAHSSSVSGMDAGMNKVFRSWGTPSVVTPLVLHEDVSGFLVVAGRESEEGFSEDEKGLLFNLALQTAVAIENSKLNENVERTYFETISALALAVEAKDPYSRGHLDRVANLSVSIAQEMDFDKVDIMTLRDAAKLHDVGKIGIADTVLTKPGPLNSEEMSLMRKHPEIGEGILKPVSSLAKLCPIVRHHHEKLDGSGYPDGLKDGEIELAARVLAVADIFDALTSHRPYRESFTPARAISELRKMDKQLDQSVVDALEKVV